MTDIFICAKLDAPPPPDWMEQHVLSQINDLGEDKVAEKIAEGKFRLPSHMDTRGEDYTERTLDHPSGRSTSAFTHFILFDQEAIDWATGHISRHIKDMRYAFTAPGRPRLGPHVDLTRNFTLIYLVQSGGASPRTVFYQEKGQKDLIRPNGYHVNDYNRVEEIASIVIPEGQWTLINSRLLHSVENISSSRRSYQIAFDEIPSLENMKWPLFLHC